jgi:hypothetical protein
MLGNSPENFPLHILVRADIINPSTFPEELLREDGFGRSDLTLIVVGTLETVFVG